MKDSKLQDMIDWETLSTFSPMAGGHIDYMIFLFKDAESLACYHSGDCQGNVAVVVKLSDGRYCWYQDSYGSCSGCDAWEDADEEQIRNLCINLAIDAEVFNTYGELIADLLDGHDARPYWKNEVGEKLHMMLTAEECIYYIGDEVSIPNNPGKKCKVINYDGKIEYHIVGEDMTGYEYVHIFQNDKKVTLTIHNKGYTIMSKYVILTLRTD